MEILDGDNIEFIGKTLMLILDS